MQKLILCLLIMIGILSGSVTASAHPHIFITPRAHFSFDDTIFTFFSVRWYFDAMSTMEFAGPEAMNATLSLSTAKRHSHTGRFPASCTACQLFSVRNRRLTS